jgi:hypothetical protein
MPRPKPLDHDSIHMDGLVSSDSITGPSLCMLRRFQYLQSRKASSMKLLAIRHGSAVQEVGAYNPSRTLLNQSCDTPTSQTVGTCSSMMLVAQNFGRFLEQHCITALRQAAASPSHVQHALTFSAAQADIRNPGANCGLCNHEQQV